MLLLDFEVAQNQWVTILPSVVFALNTSISASTKFSPYEVIYGRRPVLPIDLIMGTVEEFNHAPTPDEYIKDLRIQLRDIILKVGENLEVSREKMMAYYNKNVLFHDYRPGEQVWLKKKCFKPGESRKLAPRKTGPWTIIRKLPNGVNFEIHEDKRKMAKVVHHNRLSPAASRPVTKGESKCRNSFVKLNTKNDDFSDDYSTDSSVSDTHLSVEEDDSDNDDVSQNQRRYPLRLRTARQKDGAIPWDQLPNI